MSILWCVHQKLLYHYTRSHPMEGCLVCRGAKIHSDSWGTGSSAYDALAYDVDLFSYVNQDFLPVFAAGNFGYEEVDSTITSPSVSKNCLSVGKPLSSLLPLISLPFLFFPVMKRKGYSRDNCCHLEKLWKTSRNACIFLVIEGRSAPVFAIADQDVAYCCMTTTKTLDQTRLVELAEANSVLSV